MSERLLDYRMIALALGVEVTTVRQYLKAARARRAAGEERPGDMPEPDEILGRTPVWKPETIEKWLERRPGKGVGGAAERERRRRARLLAEG